MSEIYGYVNGKPVYSRDEFIYKARGFEEIQSDKELLEFAEKVTGHWSHAGHKMTFATYYLGDYALDEPRRSLTDKEFKRLKELQEDEIKKIEEENAKFNYSNFEGRQLTESEVRMFLDRYVERTKNKWGEDNFYTKEAQNYRDKLISKFKNGEVVPVDSYDYNSSYGSGTGSYAKTLMSDGTIRDTCFGYLD